MNLSVQSEEVNQVASVEELDALLDRINNACDPQHPILVSIDYPHESHIDIGLGSPESIVIIWPHFHEGSPGRYYMSLSSQPVPGTRCFWIHGTGHTEFDSIHIIPLDAARKIVRHFILTGERSAEIEWLTDEY